LEKRKKEKETTSGIERWIRRKKRERRVKIVQKEKTENFATTFCGKYDKYAVTYIIPAVFLIYKASKIPLICFFLLLEISPKTEEFHKTEFRGTKICGNIESTVTVRIYLRYAGTEVIKKPSGFL
jgi:hypothetical protein